MRTVSSDRVFYAFSPDLEPVIRVKEGEEFTLLTQDCFANQITREDQYMDGLDWNHINPATGPVYVEGVSAGDLIRIDIVAIEAADQAVVCACPNEGTLGKQLTENETVILKNEGEFINFKNKVRIPIKPMIGVIGVAPAGGSVPNGTPGDHGGNMDCSLIGANSTLYLKANVDGGLLGVGDLHTVMGDGEIIATGAETAGAVRLKVERFSAPQLPTPFLETEELVVTIASADTLDAAAKMATERMADFLTKECGFELNDAGMLMGLVGSVNICQMVDPLVTVRFEFPKWAIVSYRGKTA